MTSASEDSIISEQNNIHPDEEVDFDQMFKSIVETQGISKFNGSASDLIIHDKYLPFMDAVPTDCNLRITIPSTLNIKIKSSVAWKMLKDSVGKDLSKFSLPVFINEPCSMLMKGAEFGFYGHLIEEASKLADPADRMVKVSTALIAVFNQVHSRVNKPFNSLLGETYELVTPKFRFISEMVSHHPPIFALQHQGENFEMTRMCDPTQKFTGKQVQVSDPNLMYVRLQVRNPDGSTF